MKILNFIFVFSCAFIIIGSIACDLIATKYRDTVVYLVYVGICGILFYLFCFSLLAFFGEINI